MKMAMAKQYCDLERNTKDMAAFLTPFSPPNDSHHVDALCVSRSAAVTVTQVRAGGGDGDYDCFSLWRERESYVRKEGRERGFPHGKYLFTLWLRATTLEAHFLSSTCFAPQVSRKAVQKLDSIC